MITTPTQTETHERLALLLQLCDNPSFWGDITEGSSLNEAVQLARTTGQNIPEALLLLSSYHLRKAKYTLASETMEDVLIAASPENASRFMVHKRLLQGKVATKFGRFAEARELTDNILSALNGHANSELAVDALLLKCAALEGLCQYPDAMSAATSALEIAPGISYTSGEAEALGSVGSVYTEMGDYTQAHEYELKALDLWRSIGNRYGQAITLNRMGSIYWLQSNHPEALKTHLLSLRLREELGDRPGMGSSYNNIANIYNNLASYEEALKYYDMALEIFAETGSKLGEAASTYGVGVAYHEMGKYPEALKFHLRSLEIRKVTNGEKGLTASYNYIGNIYAAMGDYEQALKYQLEGLEMSTRTGGLRYIGNSLSSIGRSYIGLGNYEAARPYLLRALETGEKIGEKFIIREALHSLIALYRNDKNFEQALNCFEQYHKVNNEIAGEQTQLTLSKLNYQHDIGLKEKEAALLKEQNRLIAAEKENADMLRIRAEQSEKFKEQFLANMSHELRTPMNAVLGLTNLVLDSELSEKQRNYLLAVKKSSDNLLVILNDILDLSKLEAGKMEMEQSPFRLREQVEHVMHILHFKAEEKGLKFSTHIGEVPAVIIGDAPRLNQILINLLGNAIKFTQHGFVKLSITGSFGSAKGDIATVRFVISDSGIGMSPEQLGKIFESFVQGETSISRRYGGTGLGLSICKTLIELHGGTITVASTPGTGSEFTFTIPYRTGNENDIANNMAHEIDYSQLSKLKILVAEDNEFNQIVIKDTLENMLPGIKVDIAANGKLAINMLLNSPPHGGGREGAGSYDIVLMDIHMPEMDGYEATRFIRKEMKLGIPVIALTASVIKSDLDKCTDAGMDGYIPKPFQREELLNELIKHCKC